MTGTSVPVRPFEELSRAGQLRRLRRLAQSAVRAYPVDTVRITPLPRGFNTNFRVYDRAGQRYVLRVARPDGPTVAMVRSEATWLAALRRDTDLMVPGPVPTRDGELVTIATDDGVPEPRVCVLFRWVDGRFVDQRLTATHLERVGAFTARLQAYGAAYAAPAGFERGLVDHVTSFGRTRPDGLAPDVAEAAAALVDQVYPAGGGRVVAEVIDRARVARDALGRGPAVFGLIHADLHQENYLFHRGEVRAIDFDDCGYGPYLYDLAVTLLELLGRSDYPGLRAALLAGYRSVAPLLIEHERLIDTFMALRAVQLMMWVTEHRTQPKFRDTWAAQLTRTLRWLQTFL